VVTLACACAGGELRCADGVLIIGGRLAFVAPVFIVS